MVFTCIFNALLILICLMINIEFNTSFTWVTENLGGYFAKDNYHLLTSATEEK